MKMLPPQRHFTCWYLLIINRLSFHSLKFGLYLFLTAIIVSFSNLISAQDKFVQDPAINNGITDDKAKESGEANRNEISNPVILNFDGLSDREVILNYYNGQKSKTGDLSNVQGIGFSSGARAIIINKEDQLNFAEVYNPETAMIFISGNGVTINCSKGFNSGFSFRFSTSESGTISIYDSTDGNGELLASGTFQPSIFNRKNKDSDPGFDNWQHFKLSFPDTARSVVISGTANQCSFDDIILGKDINGKGSSANCGAGSSGFVSILTTPVQMTAKGNLFLMGASRFGIDIGKLNSETEGTTEEGSENLYFNLNFLPKAGYFFMNNFAGGAFIDLEIYNNRPSEDTGYGFDKGTTFVIGPFVRYYIPVWKEFLPYAEAQIGFGMDNYKYKTDADSDHIKADQSVYTYRLGGGGTYFINKVVGADFFMGFHHNTYKYQDTDNTGNISKTIQNMFILQLGIVVVLDI
jgi:hypothetical protein